MKKKKQAELVPIVAKVPPEMKDWVSKLAADSTRTFSQQLRVIIAEAMLNYAN